MHLELYLYTELKKKFFFQEVLLFEVDYLTNKPKTNKYINCGQYYHMGFFFQLYLKQGFFKIDSTLYSKKTHTHKGRTKKQSYSRKKIYYTNPKYKRITKLNEADLLPSTECL